ncbi:MAG: hypothetical protein V7739_15045 [Motiliproteus sp.]
MRYTDPQLVQVLKDNAGLEKQMFLIEGVVTSFAALFYGIGKLLSLRLPFLAHPAYRIVR